MADQPKTDAIRIQAVPSPADPMKCTFKVDRPVLENRAFYFASSEKAPGSPLAERLFAIEGVQTVHVSHDEVTIGKGSTEDWRNLGQQIGAALRESVTDPERPPISPALFDELLAEEQIEHLVRQILDTQINPMVASHGGVIHLLDVKENNVFIEMAGGCQGCAMSKLTLKNGVEQVIREFVPEVGDILDVTDHAAGRNPYYSPA